MKIGTLLNGAKGFDANCIISPALAARFVSAGYAFAIRYVRRAFASGHDITAGELAGLVQAGLGVMLVQHVANPGWLPTAALGAAYGATAASEAASAGMPRGTTLWCDLEGVNGRASSGDVIQFCNQWHDAVQAAGYLPGLYVGDACGLSSAQLHKNLRFRAYWSAYNLNRDNYPAVRGVQMRQLVAHAGDRFDGCPDIDADVIHADAMGDTPTLLLP